MPPFSSRDKLQEINRELALRRKLYPGWVASGRLPQSTAAQRIALLEAIADDYTQLAASERLL